ncbi:MAG: amidohydrolase family protein [Rhizobiaceae bacterium]|nr:amidohydrolase family protein [Rhizobiaceae bacterium]
MKASNLPEYDAEGDIVSPALIDLHTHIYWGATSLGVNAEHVASRSGTGSFVDAGSAGAGNFLGFREFIAKNSDLRCFAFLNVSFAGIFGFGKSLMVGEGEIDRLLHEESCQQIADENRDLIIGIKVRAGKIAAGENGALAIEIGRRIAEKLDLPLMCHVDAHPPSIQQGLDHLQKGDLLTHCSKPGPNTVVDSHKNAIPELLKAIDRGVLLDIGHGMGGFDFEVCRAMLELGIKPDTISSDIHAQSVDGPAFDQLTALNKLIALGMPVAEAFTACTSNPAKIIGHDELGSLAIGTPADLAVFKWQASPKTFVDAKGQTLDTKRHLVCDRLMVAGRTIGKDGKAVKSES